MHLHASKCLQHNYYGIKHCESAHTKVTHQQPETAAAAKCEHDLRTVAFGHHMYRLCGPHESVLHGLSWSCLRVGRAHHRTCYKQQRAAFLVPMVCLELAAAQGSSCSDRMTMAHLAQKSSTASGHCR